MKTIYKAKYKKIIQILVKTRKQSVITQQQLADKLKKPQSYIAKTEKYERKLDILEFIELCEALGLTASEVIKEIE
ncbi:MAG: transcriptional regulator [Gammaproteobacteria bacterium]|nr:MAG: transcriptional regulator [Gammaproteobacteria bacterium]